jgi:nitronate monooxygenase
MGIETVLTQCLKIEHPIIQAPMAGGGDSPDLVATVGNAGAIGFVGAAYSTPAQIIELGRAVRQKTTRPFGINLFAPMPQPDPIANPQAAVQRVAPFFAELGLPAPSAPPPIANSFSEQLTAALETDASAFSFTFGILPSDAIETIQRRSLFLIGTATNVEEAFALDSLKFESEM